MLNKPDPKVIKKAALNSEESQSNGSLMRSTPMAVFCHRMRIDGTEENKEENESEIDQHKQCVFKAAIEDASFTHCNKTVMFVNGLYNYILTLIINGKPLKDIYDII